MKERIQDLSHPIYSHMLSVEAMQAVADLRSQEYKVLKGYDFELAAFVIEQSRTDRMMESVPSDAFRRFRDGPAFESYMEDKIQFYLYQHGDVAGLIWFGPKQHELTETLPNPPSHTFAVRIYDKHAGKGLAKPFMTVAHDEFLRKHGEDCSGLWLAVRRDKAEMAAALYEPFGYEPIGASNGEVIMVLSPERFQRQG